VPPSPFIGDKSRQMFIPLHGNQSVRILGRCNNICNRSCSYICNYSGNSHWPYSFEYAQGR
jgi:hypothetical protein